MTNEKRNLSIEEMLKMSEEELMTELNKRFEGFSNSARFTFHSGVDHGKSSKETKFKFKFTGNSNFGYHQHFRPNANIITPKPVVPMSAFQQLGLKESATEEQVKVAFKKSVFKAHSDYGGKGDVGSLVEAKKVCIEFIKSRTPKK